MKIILIKDVKKQGKSGDILTVKDGYGSFLINKGDAVLATKVSMDRLEKENNDKRITEENTIKECEKIKEKLEKICLVFKVKTGDNDKVFGSVSPKQIAEELKGKGYDINKRQLRISDSISSLGFHNVLVELHKKVVATIKIELTK